MLIYHTWAELIHYSPLGKSHVEEKVANITFDNEKIILTLFTENKTELITYVTIIEYCK